jgi:hypothetical protein
MGMLAISAARPRTRQGRAVLIAGLLAIVGCERGEGGVASDVYLADQPSTYPASITVSPNSGIWPPTALCNSQPSFETSTAR